jgi:hypothetical protein
VAATCEVINSLGPNKYELTTDGLTENETAVIEGEATVLVDALPAHGEVVGLVTTPGNNSTEQPPH